MAIPRFYIIHYVKLTAIAAVAFAVVLNRSPQHSLLVLGLFLLILLAPVYLPLLPKSPESALLRLPTDPDDQIAVLERAMARPVLFRSGPRRSVRIKLIQLYKERGRSSDAVRLGSSVLAQFHLPRSLESLLRLEISICLDRLGRNPEAQAERQMAGRLLADPPSDALGWLVKGRLFDEDHRYDEAIVTYERILSLPLFERKAVQSEAYLRLAAACVKLMAAQEAIQAMK
jgi:tetratricopeptide (TPR) repeat protein